MTSKHYFFVILMLMGFWVGLIGCNSIASGKIIKSYSDGTHQITLKNATGKLIKGSNNIVVEITDASNKPVDVSQLSVDFMMPAMPPAMPEMHADLMDVKKLDGNKGIFSGFATFEETCHWKVTAQFTVDGKQITLEGFSVSNK